MCGGLAAAARIDPSEKHRSATRNTPQTARISRHGREGISYPYSLAADYAADLLKRVARAEPERINAREWIILLYSAVFILVTWFLAVRLAIYDKRGLFWWVVLGSNQWPLLCESSALPLS